MESPSRNPLLLEQSNDQETSGDESNDEDIRNSGNRTLGNQGEIKETYRRSSSTPTDRYNFAYIAFYFLGM